MAGEAPLTINIRAAIPATAGGADDTTPIAIAPWDFTVTKVSFLSDAAVTGANTNTRKVELRNGGANGAGVTVIASKQFDAGVNAVQNDDTDVTLTGTVANRDGSAGDALVFASTHIGTGLADPGGTLIIELTRRNA